MDYEKKYNEALARARKIHDEIVYNEVIGFPGQITDIFPELRESEDERARKWLVALVENLGDPADEDAEKELEEMRPLALAYLEKQKENQKNTISIPADCASNAKCPYKIHGDEEFIGDIKDTPAYHFGFDEGVRSEREKQKEQKPYEPKNWPADKDTLTQEQKSVQSEDEREYVRIIKSIVSDFIRDKKPEDVAYYQRIYDWLDGRHIEQKPAPISCGHENGTEWSEEDEKMRTNAVLSLMYLIEEYPNADFIDSVKKEIAWLKSLRPQPQQNMSIGFMLYLDEHRPDGKMCLSNAECNEIETAFKNQSWDTILRYIEKYQPHWKPSNEQINYLGAAVIEAQRRHNESVNGFPRYRVLKELYEQLKKLI